MHLLQVRRVVDVPDGVRGGAGRDRERFERLDGVHRPVDAGEQPVGEGVERRAVDGPGRQRAGERQVHLGRRRPQPARLLDERPPLRDRLRRLPPGVAAAGQELAAVHQVAVGGGLAAGHRPPALDPPRGPGDARRARRGERGLDDDVRVVAAGEHAEHLEDDRPVAGGVDDDRRVRLLPAEHAGGGVGVLRPAAGRPHGPGPPEGRTLARPRLSLVPQQPQQRPQVGGVVGAVVDVPLPAVGVVVAPDEGVLELGCRRRAEGQRHLVGDADAVGGGGLDEPHVDVGRPARGPAVVGQPQPPEPAELGVPAALAGVPPLPRQPPGEELEHGADRTAGVRHRSGRRRIRRPGVVRHEVRSPPRCGAPVILSQKKSRDPVVIASRPSAGTPGKPVPPKTSSRPQPAWPRGRGGRPGGRGRGC